MSQKLLSHLAHVDKAAQLSTAKKDSAVVEVVPLSEEARKLPDHIIAITDARKLNRQTPYFRCPAWADLPPKAYHLHCTRDHIPLPALGLHRFAFYLFGKSSVCDYVLEHPSISSVHAALIFHRPQDCFVLVDLNSTNGVKLNGQRMAAQKPVPVPVGSRIQFGYSTRVYELRGGAPPSSKRLREEREEVLAQADVARTTAMSEASGNGVQDTGATISAAVRNAAATSTSGQETTMHSAMASLSHENANEGEGRVKEGTMTGASTLVTSAAAPRSSASHETVQNDEAQGATAEPTPRKGHFYQLVIKHKDVDNPVSRGRQKGEAITRSREDAFDIARFILRAHERSHGVPPSASLVRGSSGGGGARAFVPWTVDEFVAAVQQYCEVSSAKKKGDLGIVEEGTFAEAFDQAAFGLERGEVSKPVETPIGIHLIYRCD